MSATCYSPEFKYEFDCFLAGNVLFSFMATKPQRSSASLSPLYEDGAHLLRMLIAGGLRSRHGAYHDAITEIANAVSAAIDCGAGHAHLAEYLLYRLEGLPRPADENRRLTRLRAIIGTFYANLLITRAVSR
ncbi:hypothetical protein [Hyphomicrobium sp.]|uniref:hypothetical protein n=1 Tax=Hyphomicrobium sp. TaxID=82 RepID=UPI0025C2AD8B|nr:hypothetical protein [Hyphomicrobium sp.]MCC7252386.1 hypothetical protein [Hyphomicrobium sp.]